jgi:hypothetical protein
MNTASGEFMSPDSIKEAQPDETKREFFAYGEVVQVKRGWFEIVKIEEGKNRIVLKGIPSPDPEELTQYRVASAGDSKAIARRLAKERGGDG